MKIDLLKIAKQVEETYVLVHNSWTDKLKVYHVPEVAVWVTQLDRPRPKQPMIKMKLVTGQFQNRLSKPSDEEHEQWLLDAEDYDREITDLQIAKRMVMSLRDIEYPDISKPPPVTVALNNDYPDNEILRKKIWLDFTVLAKPSDLQAVQTAMMEMSGLDIVENDIDEVKKNLE